MSAWKRITRFIDPVIEYFFIDIALQGRARINKLLQKFLSLLLFELVHRIEVHGFSGLAYDISVAGPWILQYFLSGVFIYVRKDREYYQ